MRLHDPDRAEQYLISGQWSGETWLTRLQAHVDERAERLAIVDPPNRGDFAFGTPRRLTWSELDNASRHVAARLVAGGVDIDDVVGVQLPNVVELAITYLALMRIGAIASPFPMQYRLHEIREIVTQSDMRAVVTIGDFQGRPHAERLQPLLGTDEQLDHLFVWGPSEVGTTITDDRVDGSATDGLERRETLIDLHPNDCVLICWTSGTEGAPKGVPRAHGDWLTSAISTSDCPLLTDADTILCPFPMVNAGGLVGLFGPCMLRGCTLVLHHPFDLETFLQQIETERVTYTNAAPTVLAKLLERPELHRERDLSSLRVIGTGSAPIPPATLREWERTFNCEVLNFFGSNEGIGLVSDSTNMPDTQRRAQFFPWYGSPHLEFRAGSAPWVQLRLVDDVTGEDIDEPGHPGELRIKGPMVFAGYLGLGRASFDERGYFCSGDIFERSGEHGEYLQFLDRSKDLIIRGGMKISAVEVEALACEHPDVLEAAAVASPDPILGERTKLFIVPRDGADVGLDDLLRLFDQLDIAKYKWPEHVVTIDALPRNPVGKILKRELRSRVDEVPTRATATRPSSRGLANSTQIGSHHDPSSPSGIGRS